MTLSPTDTPVTPVLPTNPNDRDRLIRIAVVMGVAVFLIVLAWRPFSLQPPRTIDSEAQQNPPLSIGGHSVAPSAQGVECPAQGPVETFSAGPGPIALTYDRSNIWIANYFNGYAISSAVTVLRSSDGTRVFTRTVGLSPQGIAFDGQRMWIVNSNGATVSVLHAQSGAEVATHAVGSGPIRVTYDGQNIWVINSNDGTANVLRAVDGFRVLTPTVGLNPRGIAFDGEKIWIAQGSDDRVQAFKLAASNPPTLNSLFTAPTGSLPGDMAYDGKNMWVVNSGDNTVSVLRGIDGALIRTRTVGTFPMGIAFDGANLWVANSGGGSGNTVSVLRASDGALIGTCTVGQNPIGVAFDGANIWVANFGDNTVTKIPAKISVFLPYIAP